MNKNTLVVQSNQLVEAKYRLSVEEQKIIKILIAQIRRDDVDFKDYEFRINDLAEMLGMKHTNTYGVLEKITERLTTRPLKFYNPETKILLQTSWLSAALYKKGEGTVTLHFDPLLKPLLLQLQSYFTKYELGQVMQFRGQYTIRFFELKKSFLGRNKKEIVFSLKELREMLGLRKNEYKEFFDFRKRVLEPARLELLEKAEEAFTWETIKRGRGGKVVGIKITFDGEVSSVQEKHETTPQEEPKQLELVTNASNAGEPQGAVAELVEVGVSPKTAQALAAEHGAEKVREKLEMLEHAKEVKNPAGFVAKALREDWRDKKAQEEKEKQERKAHEVMVNIRKRELGTLKDKYKKVVSTILANAFDALPEDEKNRFVDDFKKSQSSIFGKLRVNFGLKGAAFQSFLMERFGHLVPDWKEFLKNENVELSGEDVELLKEV